MTESVKQQLALLKAKEYRKNRRAAPADKEEKMKEIEGMISPFLREAEFFAYASGAEQPVFFGDDRFGFHRDYADLIGKKSRFGNVIPDYESLLRDGMCAVYGKAERLEKTTGDAQAKEFYRAILRTYDAFFEQVERYRLAAAERGNIRLAAALARVPENGARDYYEALVSLNSICYALRLINTCHLPLGRFDVYMKPYFDASVAAGETKESLLELTELFFISLNVDGDLYLGVQQGDNGQSLALGGCDKKGEPYFNELSEMCLQASEDLCLIDPKINLRVNRNTPLSLYERGTRLTKKGLGFPQYSNDDIVIPALIALGYDEEDTRDYAFAACWEFIIPAVGGDVPNIDDIDYPKVIEEATKRGLTVAHDFDGFMDIVEEELKAECDRKMQKRYGKTFSPPVPLLSSMIRPCVDRGRDVTMRGGKYCNFGFHGAGIATATDALAAIRYLVFEEKKIPAQTLQDALDRNFDGYSELRQQLLDAPKMGNNDDRADGIACRLMQIASDRVNGAPNGCGGVFRMGTGSAQNYVLRAQKVGATADGRFAGDAYGANFSPSLIAKLNGPLSAIQSFTKFDLRRCCNGGPFTVEVHDTVFRNEEGERKVAQLVKTFIDLGGHQIQINSINRERLLHAKAHPEDDPNLIVRVWGWSGYFNELDTVYQDHVIRRTEFQV